jgi:hypothetical protein
MRKTYLMVRDSDAVILGCMEFDDPDAGPIQLQAKPPVGVSLIPDGDDFVRSEYLEGFVAKLVDGMVSWVDMRSLEALVNSGVAKCYTDIDAIYEAAIGKRQAEYVDAEADARAFAMAGFEGETTQNVSSFAICNPTGQVQSNQWAAEMIIARADAFKAAQVSMRAERFATQAAMRACVTPAQLDHVAYLWDEFISNIRARLGL